MSISYLYLYTQLLDPEFIYVSSPPSFLIPGTQCREVPQVDDAAAAGAVREVDNVLQNLVGSAQGVKRWGKGPTQWSFEVEKIHKKIHQGDLYGK